MEAVRSEDTPQYNAAHQTGEEHREGDDVIAQALDILASRLKEPGMVLSNPDAVTAYLKLQLANEEREQFCVMYLDTRHQVIGFEELFSGTIDACSVYPREVVKEVLRRNAAKIILAHNHPSQIPEPSRADRDITKRLKNALGTIDVGLLDHIVIGGTHSVSFAERGYL